MVEYLFLVLASAAIYQTSAFKSNLYWISIFRESFRQMSMKWSFGKGMGSLKDLGAIGKKLGLSDH